MKQILMLCLFVPVLLVRGADRPLLRSELIFQPEHWHNHASCIVETPRGDLMVCWFHGSGERTADDVRVEGARLARGSSRWSERFVLADTPGYPDTNCTLLIDPEGRLWLLWPTILANLWESALMKYKVSSDYHRPGPPRWDFQEILHVTPGASFGLIVSNWTATAAKSLQVPGAEAELGSRAENYLKEINRQAGDKLSRRLGWMTRAHPFVLEGKRLIVPLYSDGFSFSLMAITDDWGRSWHTSTPLVGPGNIQPSIAQRKNGSLYTLMRDNGPPPKRLLQSESHDRGETWSEVSDSSLPNPGSGAEVIRLRNGNWLLISNDTERGRHQLAVQLSEDDGITWPWKRYLEKDTAGPDAGSYHYPSIMQARDGSIHASYSHHQTLRATGDSASRSAAKSIKHAHFNEAWVRSND